MNVDWQRPFKEIVPGKARLLNNGSDLAILSIGHAGNIVKEALDKLKTSQVSIAHYDMRYAKPLDTSCLHEIFKKFDKLITVEDGTIIGGFGTAILEFMCDNGYTSEVKRIGTPDRFVDHGTQQELYKECGYDADSIIAVIQAMVKPGVLFNTG